MQEWDDAQSYQNYVQFRIESGDAARLVEMTVDAPQLALRSLRALAAAER